MAPESVRGNQYEIIVLGRCCFLYHLVSMLALPGTRRMAYLAYLFLAAEGRF